MQDRKLVKETRDGTRTSRAKQRAKARRNARRAKVQNRKAT